MTIDIFIPCFIDQISPETGMKMAFILQQLGCEVKNNPNQTCCGQPAYNSGFEKEAKGIAQKFLKDFDVPHPVVAPSGSCTGYIRNFYPKLFNNTTQQNSCKKVSQTVTEFTEFVVANLDYSKLNLKNTTKVTYHDGCGALRECRIKEQPRKLLEAVKGITFVEMKECETCCGFGGTFAVKFEPISTGMAYTKVHSAIDAGAEVILSSDYSCLLHLDAYIIKHQLPIKTMHLVDFLYESLEPSA